MSAVIIKEREREWDDRGSVRSGRSGQPRTFTTVKRYKYPGRMEGDDYEEDDTRIVIRERDRGSDSRDRVEYRIIEREREEASPRDRDVRDTYRIVRRQSRSPSPDVDEREVQIIRQREWDRDTESRSSAHSPYTLEKYSKSTEYFSRPDPQPIIIRQQAPQPIIIQEQPRQQQIIVRREEPSYEIIERSEAADDRQVATRPRRDEEEDYYFERRRREVDRGGREPEYSDDEREYRRRRYDDRDYYSDDDVVYIRRERDDYGERDRAHRRHLVEGALGGVAAAEIVRNHRKSQGENPGSHVAQVVGYGALGAVGAEALTRLNERFGRSRSRSRDRMGRRGRYRHRSRSRSLSLSHGQALAGVAAIAGLGALAYAAGKNNSKNNTTVIEEIPRRSRSGRRRSSVVDEEYIDEERARSESRHMDPEHRNRRVAQAGLAGAALAGLAERARSRSRSKKGKRSRSRVREGIPIVAAGLGSAALAGLYEKSQARKEEKRYRSRSRSLSGSRSRSRSRSVRSSGRRRTASDHALVEYGGDPIYPSSALERRRSRSRSRSHGRYRASDSDSSPDRRRSSKSRSRSRHLAEAAAAAGAAGVAAHEYTKRKERKRAQRERQRQEEEAASSEAYPPSDHAGHYYPEGNEFAPPPHADGAFMSGAQPGYADPRYGPHPTGNDAPAPYNPAEWGPTTGPTLPRDDLYHQDPYAPNAHRDGAYRAGPENVSRPPGDVTPRYERSNPYTTPDGLSGEPATTNPITSQSNVVPGLEKDKTVRFDLDPEHTGSNVAASNGGREDEEKESRNHFRRKQPSKGSSIQQRPSRDRDHSPASDDSSGTIEEPDLADRFDEQGRPKRGRTALADHLEDMFSGHGPASQLLSTLFRVGDL